MKHKSFRFGQWRVDPATNTLSCGVLNRQLEPRAMDVLLYLCRHPHVVVSAETLLDACWGDVSPSDNAIHKIITQLRRALDDSATEPRYIETIRKRGYRLLAELSYDDEVSQGSWLHASPFRGLEAFEEQHAAIFFGRKLSVDQLVQVVVAQAQAACAMVLVLGPSGAGKTSLVQAGLIPALKAGAAPAESGIAISAHVQLDCADMGQSGLLETLASVLLDAEIDGKLLFENTSAAALAQRLAHDLPGLIEHVQRQLPTIQLLLFIDRFEAVFRLPQVSDAERAVFINVLDQWARSGSMQLVLACRNDFYPQLASYPALMNLKLSGGHYDLTPPGSADIGQIVRHPAQVAQLRYTVDQHGEGLDELLCRAALSGADSLPLLQYCLQELYRQRSPEGELSHEAFRAMGGLEGSIGARAEQVISALGTAQIAALPHVLSQLVLVAEDETTVSSRRVPWSALRNEAENQLVQALVDAHLFVSDLQGGAPTFGLAHEALLRRWPRVVAWVEEHRQALQVRSRISAQAKRWQESGRKRDMLLPSGTQTNQARQLQTASSLSLTPQEQQFIQLSLQSERRSERVRMAVMAVVTSLAVLAGVLGLTARSAQTQAEAHRAEAEGLMGYMLGEFADKLRPLGKLDLLDSVSTRALKYLSDPARMTDSDTALAQRAKSLQLISEVRIARADPVGANTALLAGRAILLQQLQNHPTDLALRKSAGENAFWLGQIHLDQKEWEPAERYFREYRDHSDQLAAAAPADVDSWIEQSFAHSSLGTVALRRGDVANAADEFALSVELKTRAYAHKPTDKQIAADLADSLSWQASARMQQGKLAEAKALYSRSLALLQTLHQNYPDEVSWVNELAATWSHQSDLKQALGQLSGAHEDARQAQSLLQAIVDKDRSNRNWQRNLYIAELRLFDTDTQSRTPEQALAQLGQLQRHFSELSSLDPKHLNLQMLVAKVQQRKAAVLLQQGDATAAAKELQPALDKLRQLHGAVPSDQVIMKVLIEALLLNADLEHLRASATAQSHCDTVRTLLRPLVNNSSDFLLLAPWVKAHVCMNQSEQVGPIKKQLEAMPYRDTTYLQYISTHPSKKANS
ncbi:DNA-binding winged helix-turn-helix (wHTH) domain-containing protein [Duganella sp. CF402]|uniref:nSTAND1 domain-containing NTPase n=1 Tax=unclassified Duganella TaxID=2636909 RepID=UPI0008D374DC|nr:MULTISPECIES: winged helix-turn-helix domain-containing protein [unclassified Duganella]RZT10920.1 DNA-binding winged helix-turn-helix (wHTH) protein [Duganella sp. BK701]SEK90070.1 DNA-binding winged helix-turn-helix (wHTH) domain-containing protein [Duganella sp. CF402]